LSKYMSHAAAKRVLIVGYYGFGLIGDEAILEAMLGDLRKLRPDISFYVTSQSPPATQATHGVEAIQICDTRATVDVLKKCDLVIVGGGGIYNEYAPWRPEGLLTQHPDFNVYCASIPILAAMYRKPCMIYAAGVEPLYSQAAREQVANAFAVATGATVRDYVSLKILKSTGFPIGKVEVTADPSFGLPDSGPSTTELLTSRGMTVAKPVVGVQLRHWNLERWDQGTDPNPWEAEVSRALDIFVEKNGGTLLFVPFQQSPDWAFADDRPISERVRKAMKHRDRTCMVEENLQPGGAASLFAGCDLVLAMRFHSVILSVKNAVPCVAIAYSLKVKGAMDRSGLGGFALELEKLTADHLAHMLEECYADRERIKNDLKIVSGKMKHIAFRNAKLAIQLLENRHGTTPAPASRFAGIAPDLIARQTELLVNAEAKLASSASEGEVFRSLLRHMINEGREYKAAEDFLLTLVKINPHDSEWHYLLAFCLQMQKKDLEDALRHYGLALEQGFSEFWVRFNRGSLYLESGNLPEAQADIERALELNPEHAGARELINRISTRQTDKP
jgi:polysaccharide pyruvyl transferase CsaB